MPTGIACSGTHLPAKSRSPRPSLCTSLRADPTGALDYPAPHIPPTNPPAQVTAHHPHLWLKGARERLPFQDPVPALLTLWLALPPQCTRGPGSHPPASVPAAPHHPQQEAHTCSLWAASTPNRCKHTVGLHRCLLHSGQEGAPLQTASQRHLPPGHLTSSHSENPSI